MEIVLLALTSWVVFSVVVTVGLHLAQPHGREIDEVAPMPTGGNDSA